MVAMTRHLLALGLIAAIAGIAYGQSTAPETFNKGPKNGGGYGGWNGGGGGGGKRGSLRLITVTTATFPPETDPITVGQNVVLIKSVAAESDPSTIIGELAATGITFDDTGDQLVNYQLTLTLDQPVGRYPAGKIFLVGDGSGPYAPTNFPKATVGGTGPYVGRLGSLVAGPNGLRVLTFTN
eukprot:gene5799-6039_t